MDHLLIGSVVAFLITFSAIPIIIRVAEMKHLFDVPDDDRKVHANPIPSLGGIGIFAGFILALLIAVPNGGLELQFIAAAFMVIFFVGIKDDIVVLTPLKKFLGQLVAAAILIFKGGVIITSMYGFLGINELPYAFGVALTFFTIIVITNSFNLIDGVDGLAGSLGLLATSAMGVYFFLAQQHLYSVMAFSMAGALSAFLIFNVSPAKIFMGDTGSLMVGTVNSILVIKFIQIASTASHNMYLPSAPAIGFAILFVPLFDTLRIFGYRILSRRSPFSPDRNHVHHLLLEKGCSHNMVTFLAAAFNIAIIAFTFIGRNLGNTILLLGLVSVGFSTISLLIYTNRNKRRKFFQTIRGDKDLEIETKVITLKATGTSGMEAEEIAK
jgi:UDP-GlcNAc:undecaprenyl-phosphate/decaprenyl-phosphate GlcNAc-1-phosphate transferase